MLPGDTSPSSRRAWIEIKIAGDLSPAVSVALLAEGVDRNIVVTLRAAVLPVALLAEGVDRNWSRASKPPECKPSPSSRRAWIEIIAPKVFNPSAVMSPSSRRAWIEIGRPRCSGHSPTSPSSRRAWIEIDRQPRREGPRASPSSRRAWIEIFRCRFAPSTLSVALLAEGVDRNRKTATAKPTEAGVALLAEGVDRNI